MALNAFYEDELTYLRELGREFAQANPKLSAFLGRDANDPDVERLLEGFAFLVARLRQRLDDEFPELVHSLLQLVWPHYLRPIPPITTVAFDIAPSSSAPSVEVRAGTTVRSRPVEGVACTFATSYAVDVLPLAVTSVRLENRATSARLQLQIKASGRNTFACIEKGRLRLFFETEREPQVGRTLLAWLMRHLHQITVTAKGQPLLTLGPDAVKPGGWAEDEAVLAWPKNTFSGFRLIQEYLVYPTKFNFVDISGLGPAAGAEHTEWGLTIDFTRPFPDQMRVSDGQIRLNCTPAINLFSHEAMPVRIDRAKSEHRVLPMGGPGYAIHSVDEVVGYMQGRPERLEFVSFDSLRHDLPGAQGGQPFFRTRVRSAIVGRGVDHYISFVDRLDRHQHPEIEVASLRLTCSNGPIADRLPVGAVDQPTSDTPNAVTFNNITAVVQEVPPPLNDNLLWRLVANLARNYGSLADVDALRSVIAAYDFRAVHDAQARRRLELLLEALERFDRSDGDAVVRGIAARARNIELSVAESKIGGEGELFLFGSILDAFLASYTAINMLHRFSIRGSETNVRYTWPMRIGTAPTL